MCGADKQFTLMKRASMGSSPHVRSRRHQIEPQPASGGIISACTEQTASSRCGAGGDGDYLRVCGADGVRFVIDNLWRGSSPRVRSRLECETDSGFVGGSSPRVRSRRRPVDKRRGRRGIISACAEQTVEFYADSDRLESSKYSIAAMKEMSDVAKSTS